MALYVLTIGVLLAVVNITAIIILNHRELNRRWKRYKHNKRIDEMLNHAVNNIEIKNLRNNRFGR